MNYSKRYRQLLTRCSTLRSRFLPKEFSSTGEYSAKKRDAARAYRLMVHAEIESYLEDRVREAAQTALSKWTASSRLSKTLLAMLAHAKVQLVGPLAQRVNYATETHVKLVKQNNGLKKSDIISMFTPIGIEESELDSAWLASMDSFGVLRGAVAHNSSDPKLTTLTINPEDEFVLVNQLLAGIETVDELIEGLIGE